MIAIGCDHGGFSLKKEIIEFLKENGYEYEDFGTFSEEACDYPLYAGKVAEAVQTGKCEKGIIVCGTGIGVSIAANKYAGIRAALCGDCFSAKACREHNDANVLTLGERVVGPGVAREIVNIFLETPFSGVERHVNRVNMLKALDKF